MDEPPRKAWHGPDHTIARRHPGAEAQRPACVGETAADRDHGFTVARTYERWSPPIDDGQFGAVVTQILRGRYHRRLVLYRTGWLEPSARDAAGSREVHARTVAVRDHRDNRIMAAMEKGYPPSAVGRE